MASVGEPITRPRYTEQRDRSQTVLAAPRDTKGATPHQAVPGAPLVGRPGVGNCLPRTWLPRRPGTPVTRTPGDPTTPSRGWKSAVKLWKDPACWRHARQSRNPWLSGSFADTCGRCLKRIGRPYPIFHPPQRPYGPKDPAIGVPVRSRGTRPVRRQVTVQRPRPRSGDASIARSHRRLRQQ